MNNASPTLIDTHAHLDDLRFSADLRQVLSAARNAGVSDVITIGCDLKSSATSVRLAAEHDGVFAAVGIHPHHAQEASKAAMDTLRRLARHDKVVAIGETGLDYFRDRCPRPVQQKAFREQIALAKQVGLPLIIHDRDAHQDVLKILREERAHQAGGVLHCFSGDLSMAHTCIEMGFYLSFPGTLTYPANQDLRDIAAAINTDRILLETDCPYLAPQSRRGRRNEPAFLVETAVELARIKGLSSADIARITRLNSHRLFGISPVEQPSPIAYPIRNSLYLNITNRCSNRCTFCAKFKDFTVKGHSLKLEREPTTQEVIEAVGDVRPYKEIVFCGYGEPLLRLDLVKEVARCLKKRGARVRINTDGQANLVHKRNILPELSGLVDAISVSLNAADAAQYQKVCQSQFGMEGYRGVKEFIRQAKYYIPSVTASVVSLPGIDIEACRKIVEEELKVKFLLRHYNEVG